MTIMNTIQFPWWGPGGQWGMIAEEVPLSPPAPEAKQPPVQEGTRTLRQAVYPPSSVANVDWGSIGTVGAYGFGSPSDSSSTNSKAAVGNLMRRLASTYPNYRRMRADGIVAIGREIADALVCTNEWSYEPRDETVPQERVDLVKNTWEGFGGNGGAQQGVTMREYCLSESCRAKDYGNHTLEVVWGDGAGGRTTVTELLPLLPENTKPLVYQNTRTFAGVRNWGIGGAEVDLTTPYCVRFIYDAEAGDLFGRSRFENCKDWVQLKWDTRDKIRTDLNTTIGNIMQIGYPLSDDRSVAGNAANEDRAKTIGIALAKGLTVTVPEFSMADQIAMARNNIDPTKLSAWKINRLDTGGNNFDGFKAAVELIDEQILFGLLVLPRSIREAQHGAKADAEQHTDSMATLAWRWISYVVGIVNNVTDDILEQNFGKDARGSVRVKAAPISDDALATLKQIFVTLLTGNPNIAVKVLDIKSLLEKLKIKPLPDFDQQVLVQQLAAQGAGSDVLSNAERMRHMGYDDKKIKKIQDEKADQDKVPTDPDGLGNR